MSSDEKLRECPLCNAGYGEVCVSEIVKNMVCCDSCGCNTGVQVSIEDAIKLWNARPPQDSWIPCSEHQPDEDGIYEITYQHKASGTCNVCDNHFYRYRRDFPPKWVLEREEGNVFSVIAWKPKSAPYQIPRLRRESDV